MKIRNSSSVLVMTVVALVVPVPQNNGQAILVKLLLELAKYLQNPQGVINAATQAELWLQILRKWDLFLLNGAGPFLPAVATGVLAVVMTCFALYWLSRLYDSSAGMAERWILLLAPWAAVALVVVSPSSAVILAGLHTYFSFITPDRIRVIFVRA